MRDNGAFETVAEAREMILSARKQKLPGADQTWGIYRTKRGDIVIMPPLAAAALKTYQWIESV